MSKDKTLAKPMEVTPVPDLNEIKEVVGSLVQSFIKEEAGNTVTKNNMAGLAILLMQALDGKITMKPPEKQAPVKG